METEDTLLRSALQVYQRGKQTGVKRDMQFGDRPFESVGYKIQPLEGVNNGVFVVVGKDTKTPMFLQRAVGFLTVLEDGRSRYVEKHQSVASYIIGRFETPLEPVFDIEFNIDDQTRLLNDFL